MAKEKRIEESAPASAAKTTDAAPVTRVRAATRAGRFVAKNKSRLPRRQKKMLQSKALKSKKLSAAS